jgi:hypothetical protein
MHEGFVCEFPLFLHERLFVVEQRETMTSTIVKKFGQLRQWTGGIPLSLIGLVCWLTNNIQKNRREIGGNTAD